jgi:HlyD family secretion protein
MRKSWLLFLVLPVLLLLWWLTGRSGSSPQVHVAAARPATIESIVSTNGKAEPAQWAAARAEAGGIVQTVDVQRGATVSIGQRLVSLDQTAAQSDLAAAVAREEEAAAESTVIQQGGRAGPLASADAAARSAEAAVSVAQRNLDSLLRLQKSQAATQLQVNDARDALNRAQLQLSAAQEQKRSLVTKGDQAVALAKYRDAKAAVSLAQNRLTLRSVLAPVSGTVYQFDLKIGAYLQPGEQVALIGNLDQIKVTVYVDEPDLGRVSLGMPVRVTWDGRPGQVWSGVVDKMPTEVTSLGTRTVGEVSSTVSNPDHQLLPGVTVNAVVTSKLVRNALAIPKSALHTLRGQTGVYRLQGNVLVWTPVTAGVSDLTNVQILSGLNEGAEVADRVIAPSDAELTDGLRVRPERG